MTVLQTLIAISHPVTNYEIRVSESPGFSESKLASTNYELRGVLTPIVTGLPQIAVQAVQVQT